MSKIFIASEGDSYFKGLITETGELSIEHICKVSTDDCDWSMQYILFAAATRTFKQFTFNTKSLTGSRSTKHHHQRGRDQKCHIQLQGTRINPYLHTERHLFAHQSPHISFNPPTEPAAGQRGHREVVRGQARAEHSHPPGHCGQHAQWRHCEHLHCRGHRRGLALPRTTVRALGHERHMVSVVFKVCLFLTPQYIHLPLLALSTLPTIITPLYPYVSITYFLLLSIPGL